MTFSSQMAKKDHQMPHEAKNSRIVSELYKYAVFFSVCLRLAIMAPFFVGRHTVLAFASRGFTEELLRHQR